MTLVSYCLVRDVTGFVRLVSYCLVRDITGFITLVSYCLGYYWISNIALLFFSVHFVL